MNIPNMIYGAHGYGNKTEALVEMAIKLGYTALDSAAIDAYHYNETALGQALAKTEADHNKIWIQTKFTPNVHDDLVYNSDIPLHNQVMQSFHDSLSTLDVDYINAYIVHSTISREGVISEEDLEIWQAMERVYQAGQSDYLGFSNLSLDNLKIILENAIIKPSFLQNGLPFSKHRPNEIATLKYCLENAITYQAFGLLSSDERMFGLLNKDEILSNPKISQIAKNHNVTNAQVILNFASKMGMQVLVSASTEKHARNNLDINFDLTIEEINEISSLTPSPSLLLSIYSQLQNGTLTTLKDIIQNIRDCKSEQLPDLMEKISHYIPKLDPTSLAEIVIAQGPSIIAYLKQYGANFSELTSNACAKIIASQGSGFIEVLKNQLHIPAEKLLLASLKLTDSSYFEELIKDANLNNLSQYDILQIIQTYPNLIESFPISENLLVVTSILGYKDYFDDLVTKIDLGKLTNADLVRIIINEDIGVIANLYNNSANFSQLTGKNFKSLVNHYGHAILKEFATIIPSIAHKTLLATNLDDLNLFDELIDKADLSKLNSYTKSEIAKKLLAQDAMDLFYKFLSLIDLSQLASYQIEPILQANDQIVDTLIHRNVLTDELILATTSLNDQKALNHCLGSLDLKHLSGYIIFKIIERKGPEVISELKQAGADLNKLDGFYTLQIMKIYPNSISSLIEAGVVNEDLFIHASTLENKEYFDNLLDKVDLNKLYIFQLQEIITNKAQQQEISLSEDLYSKLAYEVSYRSTAELKKETLSNLLNCIFNKDCLEQCIVSEQISHLECYGKFNQILDAEL